MTSKQCFMTKTTIIMVNIAFKILMLHGVIINYNVIMFTFSCISVTRSSFYPGETANGSSCCCRPTAPLTPSDCCRRRLALHCVSIQSFTSCIEVRTNTCTHMARLSTRARMPFFSIVSCVGWWWCSSEFGSV